MLAPRARCRAVHMAARFSTNSHGNGQIPRGSAGEVVGGTKRLGGLGLQLLGYLCIGVVACSNW